MSNAMYFCLLAALYQAPHMDRGTAKFISLVFTAVAVGDLILKALS